MAAPGFREPTAGRRASGTSGLQDDGPIPPCVDGRGNLRGTRRFYGWTKAVAIFFSFWAKFSHHSQKPRCRPSYVCENRQQWFTSIVPTRSTASYDVGLQVDENTVTVQTSKLYYVHPYCAGNPQQNLQFHLYIMRMISPPPLVADFLHEMLRSSSSLFWLLRRHTYVPGCHPRFHCFAP